mgnify:CR=1 FL=1
MFIKNLKKCSCKKGNCLQNLTVQGLANARQEFWGKAPSRDERRAKITDILNKARKEYNVRSFTKEIDPSQYTNCFCFVIDCYHVNSLYIPIGVCPYNFRVLGKINKKKPYLRTRQGRGEGLTPLL